MDELTNQGSELTAVRIAEELLDCYMGGAAPNRSALARKYGCSTLDIRRVEQTAVFKTLLLEALAKAGMDHARLAGIISEGIQAWKVAPGRDPVSGGKTDGVPDHAARIKYLKLLFELLYGSMPKAALQLNIDLGGGQDRGARDLPPVVPTPAPREAVHAAVDRVDRAGRVVAMKKRAAARREPITIEVDPEEGNDGEEEEEG